MNKNEFLALAIRLFGIFLLVAIIRDSSAFIFTMMNFGEGNNTWILVSSIIISIFVLGTLILIKFPLTIAGKIMPKSDSKEPIISFNKDELQYVGFTIIGMFLLVRALPDLFYWASFVFQVNVVTDPPITITAENKSNMISTACEIIIGITVLFGANGLQNIIYKIRTLGAK